MMNLHLLCLVAVPLVTAQGDPEGRSQTATQSEDALDYGRRIALYAMARKQHPEEDQWVLSQRGLLKCRTRRGDVWFVWISTLAGRSALGSSVVCTFGSDSKLRQSRTMGPLNEVCRVRVSGVGDAILVEGPSASGTGLWERFIYLLNPDDLACSFWEGDGDAWSNGVKGRNDGHIIRETVLLMDVDADGKDELLQVKSTQVGWTHPSISFSDPEFTCNVFKYDPTQRRFVPRCKSAPRLLWPVRVEKKQDSPWE